MWEKLRSIWTIPDLRKKILFTLMILLITRVLANIPVPLTHAETQSLVKLFSSGGNQNLGQLLGLLDDLAALEPWRMLTLTPSQWVGQADSLPRPTCWDVIRA